MMNLALLTVRVASTRLPEKCFLPLGGTSVLEFVHRRAELGGLYPVVCTSVEKSDDKIMEYCEAQNMRVFRGPLEDKLKRWYLCARKYNSDVFHTIDVDDPLFDPEQVKQSIKMCEEQSLDAVFPSVISASGGASMGYTINVKALGMLLQQIPASEINEMVDVALAKYFNPNKIRIYPAESNEIAKTRITLDYAEDYAFISSLIRILGDNPTRKEISELLSRNPDMYKINWFRNEDWAQKQSKLREGK